MRGESMKFITFNAEDEVNEFLKNKNISIVDFKRTLFNEECAYGKNTWIETAILYIESEVSDGDDK